MKDKFFVDTNILIYAICEEVKKSNIARTLLISNANQIVVSSQVINEFIAVSLKKNILPMEEIFEYADGFMKIFDFVVIRKEDIRKAMFLKRRYKYNYWDSLIIASALESGCGILYTEDMQDGQVIEGRLRIVNPFVSERSRV